MGTLAKANHREIGVWVQTPGELAPPRPAEWVREGRNSPPPVRKSLEVLYAKSCNLVHFWLESGPFTMGTAFPRIPPRNDA